MHPTTQRINAITLLPPERRHSCRLGEVAGLSGPRWVSGHPKPTRMSALLAIGLLILALASASALGQITAFSYTGFLLDGGTPANGSNDLQFTLYSVASGGAPVAGSLTKTNQPVNNGVFVVSLDFGDVFDGSARWLEISARPGGSANPFTNTFPRQAITAAPYAAFANNCMPPGAITAFAGTNVPTGWLPCDGRAVSRTNYARLFAAVGTTWGSGDGTTTFNLPDLRGMFMRGAGTNWTQAKAAGGNFSGGKVGDYVQDQTQGHRHIQGDGENDPSAGRYGTASGLASGSASVRDWGKTLGDYVSSPIEDGINGPPRTGTETKPASYSVNYIIKY